MRKRQNCSCRLMGASSTLQLQFVLPGGRFYENKLLLVFCFFNYVFPAVLYSSARYLCSVPTSECNLFLLMKTDLNASGCVLKSASNCANFWQGRGKGTEGTRPSPATYGLGTTVGKIDTLNPIHTKPGFRSVTTRINGMFKVKHCLFHGRAFLRRLYHQWRQSQIFQGRTVFSVLLSLTPGRQSSANSCRFRDATTRGKIVFTNQIGQFRAALGTQALG